MLQNSPLHTKAGISESLSGKSRPFLQKPVASKPTCAGRGRWPLRSTMQKRCQPLSEARSGVHQAGWRWTPRPGDKVQGGESRARPGGTGKEAEEAPNGWRVRQENLGKTEVGLGNAEKRGGHRKKSHGEQDATNEQEDPADGSGHLAKTARRRGTCGMKLSSAVVPV